MHTEGIPFHQPLNPAERAAVLAFPELLRIIELRRGSGWVFLPVFLEGKLSSIAGWRGWQDGWIDAIVVMNDTDANAYRYTHDGGVVWSCEGSLIEVADGLVDLPAPSEPGAPTLVKGTAPGFWLPGMPLQ